MNLLKYITLPLLLTILVGCNGAGTSQPFEGGDTLTTQARLLTLVDHGNGIIAARIADPWNDGQVLGHYLLVDRNLPDNQIPVGTGATIIPVPVSSALVYSGVHTGAFEELGAIDRISGVADAPYFSSPAIRNRLASGRIADVGNSLSPNLDRIIDLDPQVIILSPYENSGHGILQKTGIDVIDMADYMEPSPLGRAEWILFIGALTGNLDGARQIFAEVADNYNRIRVNASHNSLRPLVVSELPFSGVWYQPGGNSYAARLIRDAGGRPLLDDDKSKGSVQMDIANVYDRAVDADFWLVKNAGRLSAADVPAASTLLRDIRAFRNRNIFYANTLAVPYYDDIAFHPDRILADMAAVFAGQTDSLTYFKRVE